MALPLKKRKMNAQGGRPTLTKQVAKLTRQVNANKPELRQFSYVTPTSATTVTGMIKPPPIEGQEFKLHGIVCRWTTLAEDAQEADWARLISPKQGYTISDYVVASGGLTERKQYDPDRTIMRTWATEYFNDGNNSSFSRNRSIHKKFSIPMICGTDGDELNPDVVKNQIHMESAYAPNVYVTIYFTDA